MARERSDDSDKTFILIDDEGNEELYREVLDFQSPKTGKRYICLYRADEKDCEEVNIQAFMLEKEADSDEEFQLLPIEDDAEWEMVQEVLNTFLDDDDNFDGNQN